MAIRTWLGKEAASNPPPARRTPSDRVVLSRVGMACTSFVRPRHICRSMSRIGGGRATTGGLSTLRGRDSLLYLVTEGLETARSLSCQASGDPGRGAFAFQVPRRAS